MHKLKLVTITGADDRVNPKDLSALSRQFPFVEWGLLLSRTRTGLEPRYPSLKWLSEVSSLEINKSVHVCGQMARAVLENPGDIFTTVQTLVGGVSRIQVNISRYLENCPVTSLYNMERAAAERGLQVLVQMPSFDHPLVAQYACQHLDRTHRSLEIINLRGERRQIGQLSDPALTILHDASGGRGITGGFSVPPKGWILPGFAGGIAPENIGAKLDEIYAMEGDFEEFWVDMESGVRTDDQLDLAKVQRVLRSCKEFIRSGPFDRTLVKESNL